MSLDFYPSARELITFPSADNDLLIIPASLSLSPLAFVFFYLSDPAKSIIWKREVRIFHTPVLERDFDSIFAVSKECDLELYLFIAVSSTWRFLAPFTIKLIISLYDKMTSSFKPSI